MAADLTPASWVLCVDRERLMREHGVMLVMRAESYADDGRVRTLVAGPGGGMLLATVSGTHRLLYQTIVRRLGEEGSEWVGQCSCPVAVDCKHAVAAIIAAQRRLLDRDEGVEAGWESVLAPLVRSQAGAQRSAAPGRVGSDRAGTRRVSTSLGLEVSLDRSRGAARATRVLLRPVTPGKTKDWIRTGVSWHGLSNQFASAGVHPTQRSAVSQLHAVAQGNGHAYRYAMDELELGEIGPVVWPLLRQCLAAGVRLAAGRGIAAVELGEGTAEVAVDLSRDDDGGLTLRPWLIVDGEPFEDGRHFLVGRPAHGVGHLDDNGHLLLWPLAQAPTESAVGLLELAEPMRIPPEGVERFLAHYYPAISRLVELRSRDGSVPEARQARPKLHLRVEIGQEHRIELEWSISYAVPTAAGDTATITLPLTPDPVGPSRDEQAEEALLDGVVPLLEPLPWLVYHSVGRASRPATPASLSGQHTARFATEVLPRLRAHPGLEVVIDGELADYGESQDAPTVHLATTEGDSHDWFDLHVTVSVADQEVPFEELFAALARNDSVMLLESGTWFSLRSPELAALRQLIEEARELDDGPPSEATVRVSPYQAGWWEELATLGVVDEQSVHWQNSVEALLRLGDADRGIIPAPDALRGQLRPYQLEGYRWLSTLWDGGLGGILADDMGLGKTMQLLAMVCRAQDRGDLAEGPVLVVAPTSVVGTWAAEAARFAPDLRVTTIAATKRRRGASLTDAVGAADLVITSYTLLRLEETAYAALPWSGVILDEAQFVKNHRSATHHAVQKLRARRCFAVTGTPLENNLMDLWSMTSLAAPGLFSRPELFTQRYRKPIEAGEDPRVLGRLRHRLRPFMLRRTKGEVATELPPKSEQTLPVALHPAHQRIYDKHLQRERQRVLGLLEDVDKNRMAIFRALTILRQLALDPSLVDAQHEGLATAAKVTTLIEQITELAAEGHRALVFSSFTGFLGKVRAALEQAGIAYSYLDGRTRNRPARIEAFKDGDDPVFLISLKAGGFGLTLTEADYVFVLDPWWNPAAEAQAVDRTHRIGQTRPVHVYRLVSTGTIEEKVVALQHRKRDLFATVIDSGQFTSGAISPEDIRGLLEE
ncbi:MAG: DEAD/DEAH box helicase [Ornithinimicrobium sp.]|uniref:DEAD/DEAH box helicase n=1 Tax=Ornithinimicrobium sp. TaxID=1977084 RepID=UPI0026DFEAC1|nr:DEAD/DEAH box helicase [Ornithinimicrobium sp.]MDO5740217.1 DEAD/DEAH box helicase [Ornithinimicrobium sp.]